MSKTVLVVDDSSVIRKQINKYLTGQGYTVYMAKNGIDGLQQVDCYKDTLDIIFSDINMPEMDGMTFLEKLHEKNYHIPIILMTTESSTQLVERAKQLGAVGWVIKPIVLPLIGDIIARI